MFYTSCTDFQKDTTLPRVYFPERAMYLIYVFTGISHREFCQRTPTGYSTLRFFKPHNVTVGFRTNIHPYGTSGFCIVFPYHKYTHSVVPLLEFHHQRKMTRKKSNEWIERVHGMGFKGGNGVQRIWGRKETHTNFFHSKLNRPVSCGTELKGFFLSQNTTILCSYLYLSWRHVSAFDWAIFRSQDI